ncbi:DegT/DnrJ/EryC1/StrS family aminotransferase [Oleidesulfovibrio alaskensis]|uniref:DegT/DnrJ/EryC1/StrS family aminotransferase n=1 Tax=Oleidesulfovibrio alaskensis TaxID=58180 RepID=UPI001DAC88C0|nr:DegT/DnrJ/EryC1/StrS family aminotransferase [Oleidesulfovibrio alaskensis]MBG0772739.1 DegT/DnrJ/EryC1/StrS family aminotransferase [Oleidesulfovibrio alaskensis]
MTSPTTEAKRAALRRRLSELSTRFCNDEVLLANPVLAKNTFYADLLASLDWDDAAVHMPQRTRWLQMARYALRSTVWLASLAVNTLVTRLCWRSGPAQEHAVNGLNRNTAAEQAGPRPLVLIDTFFHMKRIVRNGRFNEVYLPGLSDALEEAGVEYAYLPRVCEGENPLVFYRALRVLQQQRVPVILDTQLFTVADLLRIGLAAIRAPFALRRVLQAVAAPQPPAATGTSAHQALARWSDDAPHDTPSYEKTYGNDDIPSLEEPRETTPPAGGQPPFDRTFIDRRISRALWVAMHDVTARYYARGITGRRLGTVTDSGGAGAARALTVVSWYENQQTEKLLFRGIRRAGIACRIAGAQLLVVPPEQMNMQPDMAEEPLQVLPDTILTLGPHALAADTTGRAAAGAALRYRHLFAPQAQRACPARDVLILLSISEAENRSLLRRLRSIPLPLPPDAALLVKFHPDTDPAAYAHLLPRGSLTIGGTMPEALSRARLVIGTGSGSLAEAACRGIPVIAASMGGSGALNYMPEPGRNTIWFPAGSTQDILDHARRLLSMNRQQLDALKHSGTAMRDTVFFNPSPERILAMLGLADDCWSGAGPEQAQEYIRHRQSTREEDTCTSPAAAAHTPQQRLLQAVHAGPHGAAYADALAALPVPRYPAEIRRLVPSRAGRTAASLRRMLRQLLQPHCFGFITGAPAAPAAVVPQPDCVGDTRKAVAEYEEAFTRFIERPLCIDDAPPAEDAAATCRAACSLPCTSQCSLPDQHGAGHTGTGGSVSFAAARMGLYALLKASGVGAGDEVILTAFTCAVMADAVLRTGATPVYTDVDPVTLGTCPQAVERALTDRTRAVVAQHSFGIPCRIEDIALITRSRGVLLIEDCALTLGSRLHGRTAGTFGDAAIFSTDHTKPLNTLIGGVVYTRNTALYDAVARMAQSAPELEEAHQMRLWKQLLFETRYHDPARYGRYPAAALLRRLYGRMTGSGPVLLTADSPAAGGAGRHTHPYAYPARMPAFLARGGTAALRCAAAAETQRRVMLQGYLDAVADTPLADYVPAAYYDADRYIVPHRFVMPVPRAEKLLAAMEHRVDTAWTWFREPVVCAPAGLASAGYVRGECPVSETVCAHIVNWPVDVPPQYAGELLEFFRSAGRRHAAHHTGQP